ncbi:MAG TPA: hypothetical protein VMP67_03435 [Candidatus Limnocylindria bacterium]|nr:hypothetical protein [Candidatus Limnocylindria bacterium]
MQDMECPWCEERLTLPDDADQHEQTCPYCLTRWSYVTVAEEAELALAA